MKLRNYLKIFECGFIIFALNFSGTSFAITTLKKVEVKNQSQIDLHFDRPVSLKQVQREFFRDVVQLSLTDVAVYPPKIFPVQNLDITKVFAYQYSPKVVRFRLSVKGNAEKYEKRISLKGSGKTISIHLQEVIADKLTTSASSVEITKMSDEEKKLLERVVKSQDPPKTNDAQKQSEPSKILIAEKERGRAKALAGGKTLPSPWRPFVMLFVVLCVFGFGVFIFLKLNRKNNLTKPGLSKLLNKFSGFGFGKDNQMLEVVATHHLGPKKSIVVIRVAKKLLVLGVANDSISLISQLQDHQPIGELSDEMDFGKTDKHSEPKIEGSPNFFEILNSETSKPGVRAQIRSKLEGRKML